MENSGRVGPKDRWFGARFSHGGNSRFGTHGLSRGLEATLVFRDLMDGLTRVAFMRKPILREVVRGLNGRSFSDGLSDPA